MSRLPPLRRLLKRFHPEGIPGPGAALYNWATSTGIFQRQYYEVIADDILRYRSQGKLLDVGTGPGWLLVRLVRSSPALSPSGVDISPAMVAKARANVSKAGLSRQIDIREASVSHLPFADAAFDIVVSSGSLHHWKEPVAGLNEIFRVLSPGGWACIYDLMADTPAEIYERTSQEFGRLPTLLLWLHSYEEPFYRQADLVPLAEASRFRDGTTHYAGIACCLAMQKMGEK